MSTQTETKPYKIPSNWVKEIKLPILCYRDIESKDGTGSRYWFETSLTYTVFSEPQYEDDYLSILKNWHKTVGFQVRIFKHHFTDTEHGFNTYELGSEEDNGVLCKRGKNRELSEEEAKEKLATHDYKVLKIDGSRLILPAVYDVSYS